MRGTRTYAYDPIGNLTLKDGVTQTYGHPTKPHAVTSRSDGLTMTYDANGNLVEKRSAMSDQRLAYDAENRLIEVTQATSNQQLVTAFTYDGDGGRVKKVTAAGTTTYFGKLYERKPDGSFVKYIWVGSTRLASKASTGTLLFYHPNHLGSTDLVTDGQGTQVVHYEYTPYGELFSTEGQVDVPHKYTGKELDAETGFYFYEARYYDPQLGRFITPDSIVPNWTDPQDFNRYTYAANNPLKYTDPTGHFSWKKFWKAAVGAFVGVVAAVLLGPAGLALVGSTMAGIIGGAVGGAISGGLNGGWKGALIGGALGGALGGIGGWAIGGQHYGVMAGMFAAGVGVTAATGSWDSFAGGLVGGIAGAFAGHGIISANSQQFANFRAGNGFVSNRTLNFRRFGEAMQERHALNVNQANTPAQLQYRPLSKNAAGDPGSTTGPRHGVIRSDALKHGKWEMGRAYPGGPIGTTDTVGNLGTWDTHITTEKSLSLGGRYIESFSTNVNATALRENVTIYQEMFAGTTTYNATNHNSNFAVNSVVYGAGGDVPEGVFAPGFPDDPS